MSGCLTSPRPIQPAQAVYLCELERNLIEFDSAIFRLLKFGNIWRPQLESG